MAPGLIDMVLSVTGATVLAALGTWMALGYARRRAMLDVPGRRRSHSIPTPRGGGIGAVLAVMVATIWLTAGGEISMSQGLAFILGLFAVAAIGWIDDHRPLPASVRLLVHVLASGWFVFQLPVAEELAAARWPLMAFQLLLLVTAINFWNFMDGIDGLVTTQTLWVAVCVALGFGAAGQGAWVLLAAAMAGASLGFLPFNFPRARIFLGDVGSGGLGFAVGALLLQAQATQAIGVWSAVLVVSALGLDASLTLATRMGRGRRWYTAHREHLYQWLVRTGRSHAQVTALYLTWNLILVMPLLWLINLRPTLAPWVAAAALSAGGVLWCLGKRSAIRRVRS